MRYPPPSFKRNGISLIEILVSVAIVSILAALILPAVKAIKDRATSVRCVSNLRQAGLAMNSYFSERGPVQTFHQGIGANGQQLGISATYYRRLIDEGYVEPNSNIFSCPGNRYPAQYGWQKLNDLNVTYGWNTEIHDGHNARTARYNITSLEKYFVIGDMNTSPEANALGPNLSLSYRSRLGFLHAGRCNLLFPDGHVEAQGEEFFDTPEHWRPNDSPPWY